MESRRHIPLFIKLLPLDVKLRCLRVVFCHTAGAGKHGRLRDESDVGDALSNVAGKTHVDHRKMNESEKSSLGRTCWDQYDCNS